MLLISSRKMRAGVGGLEPAGPVVDGAGERPFDVAEQLGFEEALGQGPAVDPDVRAGLAGAEVVDRAGDQLLARAGLAHDQDAGPSRGHLAGGPGDLADRLARADDSRQGEVVARAGSVGRSWAG